MGVGYKWNPTCLGINSKLWYWVNSVVIHLGANTWVWNTNGIQHT